MNSAHYVIRRMLRSPGFSAMVVATIALAVGVNLGVFSVTRSMLFYSLGVPDADRLVYYTLGSNKDATSFSGPAYEALRANAAIKDVLAWKLDQFRIQTPDGAPKVYGALVTGNTFSVFGLKPYLGRFFDESDDAPGGGKNGWVTVLGYSYWRTHFAANPNVIGQDITIDGATVHIIGVLPREFTGVVPLIQTDVLLPRHFLSVSSRGEDRFAYPGYMEWFVFGRLPQGVSIKAVQSNLETIEQLVRQLADPEGKVFSSGLFSNTPLGSLLQVQDGSLGASIVLKFFRIPALAMQALAAALFVFCCCNLVLLFLGRASREARISAIRLALGARLGIEVRFAMLEATVLATAGCCIAGPIAWSTAHVVSLVIQSIPGLDSFPTISPDPSVLLAAVGGMLAIACLTGAVASLWHGKKRPGAVLGTWIGTQTPHSSGSWIIGFEILASILLLTAVIVNTIGFIQLNGRPSGFGSGSAVTATLDFRGDSSGTTNDLHEAGYISKTNRILDRVGAAPGVQSIAAMNMPPLGGGAANSEIAVRDSSGVLRQHRVWPAVVSVRYFSTVGTGIVQGRDFNSSDLAGDHVCILSKLSALELFPNKSPLGEYLYQGGSQKNEAPMLYCRVVGVAEDAHLKSMSDNADAAVYLLTKGTMSTIVVRAATSTLAIEAVRNAVRAVDPDCLATRIDTIEARINDDLRAWKVITIAAAFCSSIACLILCVGFFGILSIQVTERKREIGIQIALGANRIQICISVMRKLRRAAGVGLIFGSGAALLVAAGLAKVYGLNAKCVIGGYLGSLALLAVLLVAAAAVPLRRALAASPMECLSNE